MGTQDMEKISFDTLKTQILNDYKTAFISREMSYLGRREVLTGKAKFGIFGDGKELPQIAMAKVFRNGDFRSGYYRDQTFMMAIGELTIQQFFAQLYADTNLQNEPASAGRQMTSHFATRSLNEDGSWKNLTEQKNSSSDISPTAGQMPRLLGLAQASAVYRAIGDQDGRFSNNGNEIAFGTIGDASTSEGHFWETINAGGVLQVPMVVSIWDDGYGISVPAQYQRTKSDLSEMLSGFQRTNEERGYEIITAKGWDYLELVEAYKQAEELARKHHIPCIVHVTECTQPQGHSTSGSHERYKNEERLAWEKEFDGIKKFKEWILAYQVNEHTIISEEELEALEKEWKTHVKTEQKIAWQNYLDPIVTAKEEVVTLVENLQKESANAAFIGVELSQLKTKKTPFKRDVYAAARKVLRLTREETLTAKAALISWLEENMAKEEENYSSKLYSDTEKAVKNIRNVEPVYEENRLEDGRVVVRDNFDKIFEQYPNVVVFGEDSGNIGDVNQGLEGLQEKYGKVRISDTGIREATILGQGIGMAMRGLRPIAEIQYLDYILYCLQGISDDLATVFYRTKGGQKAPVIIRTRGHRLEGIWHSGSPMGGILSLVRGVNVLVPRNLTKAAGFYNALLQTDEPAIVVESLNGYRLKEKMPSNLGEFTTPIGEVEITKTGADVTLVTYGSTWRIVMDAAKELAMLGIDAEVIDVQSLIPFDQSHAIYQSLEKTNRLVVIDEDVPGGATGYMLQKILEEQKAYHLLDSQPLTIAAKEHRPPYGTDGDYFSKPSVDEIVERVYALMHESNPAKYPSIY